MISWEDVFVFLVTIFTLLMIFGSITVKVIYGLKEQLNTMITIIRELCGDVNDYNSILCAMHKEQIQQNEKRTDTDKLMKKILDSFEDHDFII